MISESFLRNYSLKKILNAAQIQKEKLKVFYAKNIRQVFQRGDFRLNYPNKHKKNNQQIQVFYRYTAKNVSSDGFRNHNKDQSQQYKGRPKVPLKCNQISFDINSRHFIQEKQNFQQSDDLFAQFSHNLSPKSNSPRINTPCQKHTQIGFRKTFYPFNKTQFINEKETLSPKLNDLCMDSKIQEPQQEPKICLQNQEILRCSTAKKLDNYIVFREQALKKSAHRGERFKNILRHKYAKLAIRKQIITEIKNFPASKK